MLTTVTPQETASRMAMQNASVSEVFRKTSARARSASRTLECRSSPNIVTRSCNENDMYRVFETRKG